MVALVGVERVLVVSWVYDVAGFLFVFFWSVLSGPPTDLFSHPSI